MPAPYIVSAIAPRELRGLSGEVEFVGTASFTFFVKGAGFLAPSNSRPTPRATSRQSGTPLRTLNFSPIARLHGGIGMPLLRPIGGTSGPCGPLATQQTDWYILPWVQKTTNEIPAKRRSDEK
jgi:hypothetical protein